MRLVALLRKQLEDPENRPTRPPASGSTRRSAASSGAP